MHYAFVFIVVFRVRNQKQNNNIMNTIQLFSGRVMLTVKIKYNINGGL